MNHASNAITPESIREMFTYHAPTPPQVESHNRIRQSALNLALTIYYECPSSADKSAAIRLLRESVMTANASIALSGFVDHLDVPNVQGA